MTRAEFDALSAAERAALVRATDDAIRARFAAHPDEIEQVEALLRRDRALTATPDAPDRGASRAHEFTRDP